MIKQPDQLIKLILIGSSGVGKSSLLMQFAENKFSENYMTTIGVDFRFKTIKIDSKSIKFQIWDTAGQDRFRTLTSSYYRGADGIIIVYDITDQTSFQDIDKYWVPEAENYSEKGTDILILGNKSDCERGFNMDKVKSYAKSKGYDFEEVSARTADKVQSAIKNFGKKIADKKMKKLQPTSQTGPAVQNPAEPSKPVGVHLKPNGPVPEEGKKNSSCC